MGEIVSKVLLKFMINVATSDAEERATLHVWGEEIVNRLVQCQKNGWLTGENNLTDEGIDILRVYWKCCKEKRKFFRSINSATL